MYVFIRKNLIKCFEIFKTNQSHMRLIIKFCFKFYKEKLINLILLFKSYITL